MSNFDRFLINGLILLSSLKLQFRTNILKVLSSGLAEFQNYFSAIIEVGQAPQLADDEKRYFAFLTLTFLDLEWIYWV